MKKIKNLFTAVILFASISLSAQGNLCFGPFLDDISYPVGNMPTAQAMGDLNGDGKSDLVVVNNYSQSISVLINDGTGTFAAAVNYTVHNGPTSVAIGDLNGDGKPDLAVTNNYQSDVSILINTGTGTFAAAVNYSVGTSVYPISVAIGDLDGDGNADLAIANSISSGTVAILINSGTGTFGSVVNYAVGYYPSSVAIGDLNEDGKLDLAVTRNSPNAVSVLLNTGAGIFSAAVNYATGSSPKSVVIGDLNADGKLDLVVANSYSTNTVSVLTNSGSGTFAAKVDYAVSSNSYYAPSSVAIGDINGDGKQDLVTTNSGLNNISVLNNTGTGSFAAAMNYFVGNSPCAVAIGDVSGDGKSDLAVVNSYSNNVSILKNKGAGVFSSIPAYAGGTNLKSLTVGDLNGDGYNDMVVTNYGTLSIFINTGTGTYTSGGSSTFGENLGSVVMGDMNGDGRVDLAVTGSHTYQYGTYPNYYYLYYGYVYVLLNYGNGVFGPAVTNYVGQIPSSLALGDLNGDGKLDLAVADAASNSVNVLINNGLGTFATAVNYVVGTRPTAVTMGDVNADGKSDLVTANSGSSTISILKNLGTGTFSAALNYSTGSKPNSVVMGDLDSDGKTDLAVADSGSNNVSVFIQNNGGNFAAAVNYSVGTSPRSIAIGDIDSDGKLDLAVVNTTSGTISLLINSSSAGIFSPAINYTMGVSPLAIAITDVNGDGALDLAILNSLYVQILYNHIAFINPSGNTSFCQGGSVVLRAKKINNSNYNWSPGGSTADSLVVTSSGTYTLTVSNSLGACTTSQDVTVTDFPSGLVTADPAAACVIDLTAPGVAVDTSASVGTLSYWKDPSATVPLTTPTALITSGTYYIKKTTAAGACSVIKPVVVTVNPSPVLEITTPAAVCLPNTVDITNAYTDLNNTTGTVSYWWDVTATIPLSNPSAVNFGGNGFSYPFYIKKVTTIGNCMDIQPVTVSISEIPNLSVTDPAEVCAPATVNITTTFTDLNAAQGTISYWMDSAATIPLTTPAAVSVSGKYYIKKTPTGGNCSDTKPVNVHVNLLPDLSVTNQTICAPATIDINDTYIDLNSTSGVATYWSNAATTIPVNNPSSIAASGTYYIKKITTGGCSQTKPITITISKAPKLSGNGTITVCDPAADITNAYTDLNGTTGTVSYWSNAATTVPLITPAAITTSGTYYIKKIATTGCKDVLPITVTVNASNVFNTSIAQTNNTLTSNAVSANYQWVDCNANYSFITGEVSQSYVAPLSGNYGVIISKDGCVDTSDCINVMITAIDNIKKETIGLQIFPNPNNGVFTIQSNNEEGVYTIVDEVGQTIRSLKLNALNNYSIEINNLSNGIYFVYGINANEAVKQKIVVTH